MYVLILFLIASRDRAWGFFLLGFIEKTGENFGCWLDHWYLLQS